jgi:hypothetical protein
LDRLLADIRAQQSRVLVLRGEAGVGKTALMDYMATTSSGCRVVLAAGVEAEVELGFAGAQQLCAPVLDHMDDLPGPQRDALGTMPASVHTSSISDGRQVIGAGWPALCRGRAPVSC